jgi:hypothetical protein
MVVSTPSQRAKVPAAPIAREILGGFSLFTSALATALYSPASLGGVVMGKSKCRPVEVYYEAPAGRYGAVAWTFTAGMNVVPQRISINFQLCRSVAP